MFEEIFEVLNNAIKEKNAQIEYYKEKYTSIYKENVDLKYQIARLTEQLEAGGSNENN